MAGHADGWREDERWVVEPDPASSMLARSADPEAAPRFKIVDQTTGRTRPGDVFTDATFAAAEARRYNVQGYDGPPAADVVTLVEAGYGHGV